MGVELARAPHADKRSASRRMGAVVEDAAHIGRGRPQIRPARRQQFDRRGSFHWSHSMRMQRFRLRVSEDDIEDRVLRGDDRPARWATVRALKPTSPPNLARESCSSTAATSRGPHSKPALPAVPFWSEAAIGIDVPPPAVTTQSGRVRQVSLAAARADLLHHRNRGTRSAPLPGRSRWS